MNNFSKHFANAHIMHIYPMAGTLRSYQRIGYIGKLENFNQDWLHLSQFASSNRSTKYMDRNTMKSVFLPWNTSLGQHKSSSDRHKLNPLFDTIFRQDVRYMRMLCRLLFVDFVCFNYTLPSACSDMQHMVLVWNN